MELEVGFLNIIRSLRITASFRMLGLVGHYLGSVSPHLQDTSVEVRSVISVLIDCSI